MICEYCPGAAVRECRICLEPCCRKEFSIFNRIICMKCMNCDAPVVGTLIMFRPGDIAELGVWE